MTGNPAESLRLARLVVDDLARRGLLAEAALARASAVAPECDGRIDRALARLGLVADAALAESYADVLAIPLWRPDVLPDPVPLLDTLSPAWLRAMGLLPLERTPEGGLIAAMADPLDADALRGLEFVTEGGPVHPHAAPRAALEATIDKLFAAPAKGAADEGDLQELDAERLRDLASDGPAIRMVARLIDRALEEGATDIHVEPKADRVLVRLRVDGVLRDAETFPRAAAAALISRIKIMAGLDIGERRLSQDGRIRQSLRGRDIDFRVSITPTVQGEAAVLRILDRDTGPAGLARLGFQPGVVEAFAALLRRPHGIVLVTGPTGSGKTTTLYAGLRELDSRERKVLTAEDPVEYLLDGINQTQIKPSIGLTFAAALRSFLRQDPDVIMVGEIRDAETAQIAVQAALTGHLVLSTLHTNDAAGAVPRLIDMGVDPFLLMATLNGVLAQRLVRTYCRDCSGRGCGACKHSGYRGRTAIGELLLVTDTVRELIRNGAPTSGIAEVAAQEGMVDLRRDGMIRVDAGLTSIEEVLRITLEG